MKVLERIDLLQKKIPSPKSSLKISLLATSPSHDTQTTYVLMMNEKQHMLHPLRILYVITFNLHITTFQPLFLATLQIAPFRLVADWVTGCGWDANVAGNTSLIMCGP